MSLYNCLAALIGEIPFGQCRYCTPFNYCKCKVSFWYFLVATQGSVQVREQFDKLFPVWFSVRDCYKRKLQAPLIDIKGIRSIINS